MIASARNEVNKTSDYWGIFLQGRDKTKVFPMKKNSKIMGVVNSALSHLPEQKVFEKLRKLSTGALSSYGTD